MSECFAESVPENCDLHTCATALRELPCVAAVDVTGAEDPAGPTIEVTVPPAFVIEDRVPKRVVETIYDRDAPWVLGIVGMGRPAPGHVRVLVR